MNAAQTSEHKMQIASGRTKLVIFIKAPRLGAVKSRLAKTLGEENALAAYKLMTDRLLANLIGLPGIEIRFSPDDAEDEVRKWLGNGFEFSPQGSGDLGERLQRAFEESFARGFGRTVIIGSDCPYVTRSDIEMAWASLANCEAVIGPAADGGYWLIGLRSPQPRLFEEISWSSDSVFETTLERICAANLPHDCLRELNDIDAESDWRHYIAERGADAR
jgi:uncharacterized protein